MTAATVPSEDRGPAGHALAAEWDLPALVSRARALFEGGPRALLGVTGPPGAGKSTVAEALVDELSEVAVLVPMDGYHLAQVELERLGRAARKGAPDTFDAAGYAALLRRCRQELDLTVYAPVFRREIEEPIAGAIPVAPSARLVVTEGIYLLEAEPPWDVVAPLLDEVWYLDLDERTRVERLVARHMSFGRPEQAAKDWVRDVDQVNAVRIARGRARANWVISPKTPQ